MIKILGAGLSGLSAAINLRKSGKDVIIYEKNSSVGKQIHENYQCLLVHKNANQYLNSLNLNPKFNSNLFSKAIISTRKRDLDVSLIEPLDFIQRGGKNSLEYGLYKEAKKLGVKFKFKQTVKPDIMATGHFRCDMAAFGAIYKNLNLDNKKFFYMHDDRFSPVGWYFYIIPFGKNFYEVVNCTSHPYINQTKKLFFKAIRERSILQEMIGNKKPIKTFGGFGGFNLSNTAIKNNILYVGEAAGFQDPFRGFGMDLALESGYLAAKAIVNNLNYDDLWKKDFKERIKKNLYRRYAVRLLGDKAIEYAFRKVKDGENIDFNRLGGKNFIIKELFYRLELLKKRTSGYW